MTDGAACPSCGGALIRRNPVWLALWGLVIGFVAAVALATSVWLAVPAMIAMLTAAYLLTWSVWAKGRWCRACKTFPLR